MDFIEKAEIKLKHWLEHNDNHQQEYINFADQLEEAGKTESALQVRKMADLAAENNQCLKRALEAIKNV